MTPAPSVRACTVIAAAQLPHARVLAASLERAHPGARLTALVLDEPGRALAPDEPFDVLRPDELEGVRPWALFGLPERELRRSVEPFLVAHVGEPVLLLAPDVLVLGPLDELLGPGLTLVPRLLEPIPADGERPTEEEALADGLHDSGIVGVGVGSEQLLGWWRERAVERLAAIEADEVVPRPHVLDAAPELFEAVRVLRDPAYGGAHWNLHARSPAQLHTLRLAGFDPARPHHLSAGNTRVAVRGELAELCERYAADLQAAGWLPPTGVEAEDPLGPLARLANGVRVDQPLRDIVRDAALSGREFGDLSAQAGTHALLEWANGPAEQGAAQGVTRYLFAMRRRRIDLQGAFPGLEDEEGDAYVHWARTSARSERIIPDALLPLPAPEAWSGEDEPPVLGVNVAGYLRTGIGVGEAARLYVVALEAAGVPVRTEVVDPHLPKPKRTPFDDRRPPIEYPYNLVCVNADHLPGFARQVGAQFFEDKVTIGCWAWEVSTVPERWDEAFTLVDEIWTYSDYISHVLAPSSPVPVVTVPQPVLEPVLADGPLDIEVGEGFTFLFTFDFFSTERRKNAVGLVQAFKRAFEPGDGARLVVKTFNGDAKPESLQQLLRAAEGREDVEIVDRFLPVEQKNALTARCDCYVSLHRSEGFGLSLAEAMLLGKPVIATGYSGNLQFMTPANSWLVGYELQPVGHGVEMYPPDALWAEPDLDHAATLMREVRAGGDAVRERAERGRRDVQRDLSPAATGAVARARLERLAALASPEPPSPSAAVNAETLQDVRDKEAFDPERAGGSGGAGDIARKATLRAMRPYTFHQNELNARLLAALEEQARRIDDLQEQIRRAKHGIASARRQGLELEARLAPDDEPGDDS